MAEPSELSRAASVDSAPLASSSRACAIDSSLLDSAADDRYRLVKSEVRPVLRVSVRATGPRGTQAFFQTTLTR